MTCPKCGAGERHIIPVWEDKQRWETEDDPKYIGCMSCNRMMRHDLITEYHQQEETPSQLRLSGHEISRLKPLGNQNTQRLTLIEWQCVKGAAAHYGVSDWTSKVDRTLTCEENVALMKRYGTRNSSRTMKQMPELQ